MSDIHGDFEAFDKALEVVKECGADVLTISGDLVGNVFETEEKDYFIKSYETLRNLGPQIYHNTNGKFSTPHGFAKFLGSNDVDVEDDLKKVSEDYLKLEETARKNMLFQYQMFEERFNNIDQKVFLVPGNWDGKCIDDVLAWKNIHNKREYEFNGIKFIGYGGSKEFPIEIPFDLILPFNEDEAFEHLSKYEDAEIVLMHANPAGFGNGRHQGEYSLSAYLYRNSPSLILTGHTHAPSLTEDEKTLTVVANPGKLGNYNGDVFGSFLEIDIDENLFVNPIAHYTINGDSIKRKELKK